MLIDRRLVAHFDWALLWSTLAIPLLGLIVLYSAGFDPDARHESSWLPSFFSVSVVVRQLIFLSSGLVVILVAMSIPPQFLSRHAFLLYAACISLLIVVALFGNVVNGSRRWLALGTFNLQPSEPMKFALIVFLARYLSRHPPGPGGYGLKQLIVPVLICFVPVALIMNQPDLGTAMVLVGISMFMIMFMGVKLKPILLIALVGAACIYPAWHGLHDYQQKRILTLINPEADPLGSGYHIIQSKIAVGSGGFAGKGYMRGTQTQLEFLPEHTTDFIFSVLAEEWGFLGCLTVIMVYFLFVYRMLRIVARSKELFQTLLVFGVTSQILIHTVINIGMVVGLFPVVGIPLPLFSYGGSSVLSTMFTIGIVLGVSMRKFAFAGRNS